MVKPLALIPPVLFAGIAGLFAAGMFLDSNGDELPSALMGRSAPEMTLVEMAGQPMLTDAMLREGEVKLVNFWASWCGPCRVEHPFLEALADEGVPVYGINYKDAPEDALAFLDDLGNPYRAMGADPAAANALDWGVYGVPETFVVDGDGTILLRIAGPIGRSTLEDRIRPALAGPADQSE